MQRLTHGRRQADRRQALRMRTRAFLEHNVTGSDMFANDQLRLILEVAAGSYLCHLGREQAEAQLQRLVRRVLSEELFI